MLKKPVVKYLVDSFNTIDEDTRKKFNINIVKDFLVIKPIGGDGCCIAIIPSEVRIGDSDGDTSIVKYTIFSNDNESFVDILTNGKIEVNIV